MVNSYPNAKKGRLFKACCEEMEGSHVRPLLHTEVRLLSKGNCLARIVDRLGEISANEDEMGALRGNDATVQVLNLADTFGKLNGEYMLKRQE